MSKPKCKCGEPVEWAEEYCQSCWEEYCAQAWWSMWKNSNLGNAKARQPTKKS